VNERRRVLQISPAWQISLDEFQFSFVRSPGPGGQNVNKVNTKAVLVWRFWDSPRLSTEIKNRLRSAYPRRINKSGAFSISSHRFRDQKQNVNDCLNKLRDLLVAIEHPPKSRRPTRKTLSSVRRRLDAKRRRSATKQQRRRPTGGD
jgi:ribosome-associated protein